MIISRWKVAVIGLAVFAFAILIATVSATVWFRFRETDTVPDTQKLARTLNIIRTSTPRDRKVLKVLFYGQSITKSGWDKAVLEHWHTQYPDTVFVVQNRALGGFPSQSLVRTTEQDIAAFYPDLIIFHVYGDHRKYEKIIRLFRSRTAADIIVQTDHGDVMPEPRCTEGLHLTLSPPPGCRGFLWYRQREWNDEMSYHKIPAIAKTYGLAIEPQRDWWKAYLVRTGTNPRDLLIDEIHPNTRGKALMAEFFDKYFDELVNLYKGETADDVAVLEPTPQERSSGTAVVDFDGSRLELVSLKPLPTWPTVTVDGQPPTNLDGCYQVSRPSSLSTIPDWPALRRVALMHDRVAEQWTATVTNFSPDQKDFDFSVQASRSGAQGSGKAGQQFVSKSGTVEIDPDDWMFDRAFGHLHLPVQAPFQVSWSVDYACGGQPEVIDRGNGTTEYRYVLATGLVDTHHSVTIAGPAEDVADIDRLIAYKPRIRNVETVDGW